jgi:hypothetical protein
MMTVSVVMTIVWMCIEGVAAAGTDYVEGFYRDCFGLAVIVACYAALSTEVNGSFFEQMRSARWDGEDVDKHLDLISLDDPLVRSGARGHLRAYIANRGAKEKSTGAGVSSSKDHVKLEPSVASKIAREAALDAGLKPEEAEEKAAVAGELQLTVNADIECTSLYAKAMRSVGHEGNALDKAQQGEDTDGEWLEGSDGKIKINRMGGACAADKWKSMGDVYVGMAQMVTRAQRDGKIHIVARLNAISNFVNVICNGQQLDYVKRLWKSFYKGIPPAENVALLASVELTWRNKLASQKPGRIVEMDSEDEDDSAAMKKEIAKLRKLVKEKGLKGKGEPFLCILCGEEGHGVKRCPHACKTCSTATKHKHKDECGCD